MDQVTKLKLIIDKQIKSIEDQLRLDIETQSSAIQNAKAWANDMIFQEDDVVGDYFETTDFETTDADVERECLRDYQHQKLNDLHDLFKAHTKFFKLIKEGE